MTGQTAQGHARSAPPPMGVDRDLLRASLARSPRERFERAVQLARFAARLRQARSVTRRAPAR